MGAILTVRVSRQFRRDYAPAAAGDHGFEPRPPGQLSLIDAVMTAEGGEGPWITGQFNQLKAGFLLAGKDPVATDAVARQRWVRSHHRVPTSPFLHADNHLNIAHGLGLGTNVLSEINVVGRPSMK